MSLLGLARKGLSSSLLRSSPYHTAPFSSISSLSSFSSLSSPSPKSPLPQPLSPFALPVRFSSSAPPSYKFTKLLRSTADPSLLPAFSSLSPPQQVLAYYLSQAATSSYPITLSQLCPHPSLLTRLHSFLTSPPPPSCPPSLFQQISDWWVYLFANFGVHCQRETEKNKKTPSDLGLHEITRDALAQSAGLTFSDEEWAYLADKDYQDTSTVVGSIEESGGAFFPPGYKQEWYDALSEEEKGCLVAFHTKDGMKRYKIGEMCGKELENVTKWLKKAKEWTEKKGGVFEKEVGDSLGELIRHFESGDEEDFREHSKIWVRMSNDVQYCFGFVECYDDPMSQIGTFQADVTVKSHDIAPLLEILPDLERQFPFPREFKRDSLFSSSSSSSSSLTIPNAIPSLKLMGMGGLGPLFCTLAYCLPNYSDIRDEVGSKQILYPSPLPTSPPRYLSLYHPPENQALFEKYSPDLELERVVSSLCTLLHETIGHGSGKMIEGMSEKVRNERLGKWGNGLEEMRAEILALYTGLRHYDDIVKTGILGDWPEKVPREFILRLIVDNVAGFGWRRWRGLPEGTTAISQAHALADTGIMYYLLDHSPKGVVELVESEVTIPMEGATEGVTKLPVIQLVVGDVEGGLLPVVEELAKEVQRMSSEGDVEAVGEFMERYSVSTRDERYAGIVTGMRDALDEGVIETMNVFPELSLEYGGRGEVVGVQGKMPEDHLDYYLRLFGDAVEGGRKGE